MIFLKKTECNIGFGFRWYSSSVHEKDADCATLPAAHVEMWPVLSTSFIHGKIKRQQRRRRGWLLEHRTQMTIHHQLSPVCLWTVSVCVHVPVGCWNGRTSADLNINSLVWHIALIIPLLRHSSRGLLCCHSLQNYFALFMFCISAQTRKRWACDVPVFTWTAVFIIETISTWPGIKIEKCWVRVAQVSVIPPPLHHGYHWC